MRTGCIMVQTMRKGRASNCCLKMRKRYKGSMPCKHFILKAIIQCAICHSLKCLCNVKIKGGTAEGATGNYYNSVLALIEELDFLSHKMLWLEHWTNVTFLQQNLYFSRRCLDSAQQTSNNSPFCWRVTGKNYWFAVAVYFKALFVVPQKYLERPTKEISGWIEWVRIQ